MKEIPKVTIILPNFNSHLFIKKTLNSILKQSYPNWKLIIVDDASNRKTKNVLKKFLKHKKINIFWLKKNKGAGYCRNFAIKKANSKYIAFIDSDDLWKKNKLKNQIKFMIHNNYNFTYTNYETFGKINNLVISPKRYTFQKFIHNTSIGTSTMIINSNIAKKVKFTNTEICEDYYFKCRLLKKVQFAHCLAETLTKYRIRNNSLQSNSLRNFYWIWRINSEYNKLNLLDNFISLFFISLNSIKKYKFKLFNI